jgi:hypothetical protein
MLKLKAKLQLKTRFCEMTSHQTNCLEINRYSHSIRNLMFLKVPGTKFSTPVFSSNNSIGSPDPWVNTFFILQRYSILKTNFWQKGSLVKACIFRKNVLIKMCYNLLMYAFFTDILFKSSQNPSNFGRPGQECTFGSAASLTHPTTTKQSHWRRSPLAAFVKFKLNMDF